MKKILVSLVFLALVVSCKEDKKYNYDSLPAFLSDTITLVKDDRYYQKVLSPTRGTSVLVDIKNSNDTAKKFIVLVKEL